jgi:Spy/CpxP family protein refolding chaperone
MEIYSKAALAMLALALSCSPVLAQGDPQDSPYKQQGARNEFGPRGPMRPGEKRGQWGHRQGGFDRSGRRGPREFGLARLLNDPAIRQQLGITAEQATTIRQQESDFRKTEIRNRADLEVKRIDLKDLLSADKPDRAAIDSKLQEISAAQLAVEKSAIDYRLTMRDAISPAQREKLRQLMSDRWRRGGGPAHPGPHGAGRKDQRGPATEPNSQRHPQPDN